ncbi:histidine kinase N-terminal 7TM domain-containing protein [Halorussus halobius]|uniref:histidine kinase N-terminal 7TM domain-containing protein n=1 Tax=Halorussus halobius TaxID=1710537 RepID=UPI00109258CF|nr:histidine kinase N-terminal 7TM domain-containing protein [Halorussus halobius]
MQFTPSAAASILATVVSLGVATFGWYRRDAPGALPVAAFTGAAAIWTGGNALQAASATLSAKLFWVDVQYVGLVAVPVAWFAFACEYTGREEWADRRTLAVLVVPMVATLGLAWTNDYHHLIRTSSEVVTVGGNAMLDRTFGPAFWVAWAYSNLLTGVGTLVLVYGMLRSRKLYWRQTLAVLSGVTVPWLAATLFYNGLSTVEPETYFAVSGLAFAYAINRYELLDVAPVGRRTVVEQMDDPVLILAPDGRVVDANPAAARLFGWESVDGVVGRAVTDACASFPAVLAWYSSGESAGEVAVEAADGRQRHFDIWTSSLGDDAERPPSRVLVFRDVTALKRQNERLERVGHTIAHDLRNPLNVAQGRLELARADGTDADADLERVADAHRRMADIIDDVLAMARDEDAGRADRRSLRAAAERAWATVDTADATLAFDGDPGSVEADGSQLASAFENLFRNAVEHGSADATVRVGALDDGGFYVADDGPGIPERDRESVFEHGFTTRDDGNGVGLAVVADVAGRHGWRVAVTDGEDGGARFEFRNSEPVAASTR